MEKMEKEILEKAIELETGTSKHHYFFTGSSIALLEHLGMELMQFLEREKKTVFKGIVPHFSVQMPFFRDASGAMKFISELKESVSIARDCYDEFAGLILIECDEDWSKNGANKSMVRVMEYLSTLESVRFIVLLSGQKKYWNDIYKVFSVAGVWANMELKEPDISQSVAICCQMADEAGYLISEEVKTALGMKLKQRKSELLDSESTVKQWMAQIIMDRKMKGCQEKEILLKDLTLLSGFAEEKKSTAIGFVTGR